MSGDAMVLAFVEFENGMCDWLSLDGLAFYREAGRVKRLMVVTVGAGRVVPARPVIALAGDAVTGKGVGRCDK